MDGKPPVFSCLSFGHSSLMPRLTCFLSDLDLCRPLYSLPHTTLSLATSRAGEVVRLRVQCAFQGRRERGRDRRDSGGMEVVKRRKATWLYPKLAGYSPPERWGHSACFFYGVVYVFGVSTYSSGFTLEKALLLVVYLSPSTVVDFDFPCISDMLL